MLPRRYRLTLLAILGLAPVGVVAGDYDYIRGDDIYEEDYQYGLDYDGLSSIPQRQLRQPANAGGDSLRDKSRKLQQDTTQPSMIRELKRWEPDSRTLPRSRLDTGLSGSDGAD